MIIAITGSNGQVGFELMRQARTQNIDIVAWPRENLDITNRERVFKLVRTVQPDIVINTAAYTAVDRAESEGEQAYAVNCDGVANLGAACREVDAPLIHISTDYVFDGQQNRPYVEDDQVNPMGVYGASKLAGEKVLRAECEQHVIVRTSWVYGVHGHNFVKTMLRLGREQESVRVVADQCGCPTSAADIAETILSIASQILRKDSRKWGTYHYCAKGVTTWYEIAVSIFDEVRQYENLCIRSIIPITTTEYLTLAKRPPNSILECTKIKRIFNVKRKPWKQSLHKVIKELYA